jgi:hypothetical protein
MQQEQALQFFDRQEKLAWPDRAVPMCIGNRKRPQESARN